MNCLNLGGESFKGLKCPFTDVFMKAVLSSSREGIVFVDSFGSISLVNDRFLEIFPGEESFFIGRNIVEFIPDLNGYINTKFREDLELTTFNSFRNEQVDLSMHVVKNDDPNLPSIIIMIRDLSKQKNAERERDQLEAQLRQEQKLGSLGALAGGIAHEINTPLQYIIDNTNFFKDSFFSLDSIWENCRNFLEDIAYIPQVKEKAMNFQEAMERADVPYLMQEIPESIEQTLQGLEQVSRIVQAIKAFSHPNCAEKVATDLNKAIDSTLIVSKNQWKYVADLEFNGEKDLPLVPCLPGEFNQVVLNLVINAVHAIQDKNAKFGRNEKGKIKISTEQDNEHVRIFVEDTGCGIPDKIREKVFEPFFTTKQNGRGTGQGLSIIRNIIVKKHGGEIHYETEPDVGTTFMIKIPLFEVKPNESSTVRE